MLAFNVAVGIPGFVNVSRLLFQNISLLLIIDFASIPVYENLRRNMLPYQHLAAMQVKEKLFKLHAKHKLIWQYEVAEEDFPPNAFNLENIEFIRSKVLYDKAHEDDFNGVNRRKSQMMLYSEHKHNLI